MSKVFLYFQLHQPYRITAYDFFEIGYKKPYFDKNLNREIVKRVAEKSYLPVGKKLLKMLKNYGDDFGFSLGITGTLLEQWEKYTPEVLELFQKIASYKAVIILGETYYHSLSSLYSASEFERQVTLHRKAIKKHFDQKPSVFRNTELIYTNAIAKQVSDMGYKFMLIEASPGLRDSGVNPEKVYSVAGSNLRVILRNYELSDDIAFRYSDENSPLFRMKPSRFLKKLGKAGSRINIWLDFESMGEHQDKDSGILKFMDKWIKLGIKSDYLFLPLKPSLLPKPKEVLPVTDAMEVSWADFERDTSAWRGNNMQQISLKRVYDLQERIVSSGDKKLLELWSKLQTSDHFYYMSTKQHTDGEVHTYFSPFSMPHDAYVYFSNILADMEIRLKR